MFPSNRLVTVKEVADVLGVTTAAVYKWIKEASMPAPMRLGGRRGILRWSPSTINEWLEARSNDS
jgi:excisionase family DNA binding protein